MRTWGKIRGLLIILLIGFLIALVINTILNIIIGETSKIDNIINIIACTLIFMGSCIYNANKNKKK